MSELSPRTRSLLRAARRDLEPSSGARARVWSGLAAAGVPAGAPTLRTTSSPPPAGALALATAKPLAVLVVAATIVAGAWMLAPRGDVARDRALRSVPARVGASPRATEGQRAAEPVRGPDAAEREALPLLPAVAPAQTPTVASQPAMPVARAVHAAPRPSALEVELRLLSAATDAMAADRPTLALRALDLHARRFPRGVLREEREASRAIALCELGRLDEASRAEAHVAPGSPYASRIAAACTPHGGESTRDRDGSARPR